MSSYVGHLLVLFSFTTIIDAQGEFPANFSSGECQTDATLLEESDDFRAVREAYWSDNGLCFRILEEFGGDVPCTTSQSTLSDECQSLHASSEIDSQELLFCEISADGTLISGNHTFDDGSRNFSFNFFSCIPAMCGTQADVETYVLSILPEVLRDGDIDILFGCTSFFDPVAAFWAENMTWIIIGLAVLLFICVCGFLCCWWRRRQDEKEKIDPTLLYGPNLAAYNSGNGQGQPQGSVAPSEAPYEDDDDEEETSSEEEELDENEELSEDSDDSETSSYRAPEDSHMGAHDDDDLEASVYHEEHPEVTVDAAMQQQQLPAAA